MCSFDFCILRVISYNYGGCYKLTYKTTGDIIKKLRIDNGYTQNELAIMLGVKLSTIQKYESGAILNLKLETLREICSIFDVPPMYVVFPDLSEKEKKKMYDFAMRETLGLNEKGVLKVQQYINDLLRIDEYTK